MGDGTLFVVVESRGGAERQCKRECFEPKAGNNDNRTYLVGLCRAIDICTTLCGFNSGPIGFKQWIIWVLISFI